MRHHHTDCVPLRDYFEALREADQRAIQIKEQGDERALGLDREDRTYKDEKANNLRTQIESERGNYATKDDLRAVEDKLAAIVASAVVEIRAELKPSAAYVASQTGTRALTLPMITAALAILAVVIGMYVTFHKSAAPTVIVTPAPTVTTTAAPSP